MSKKELLLRYFILTLGLFTAALGISLITKAELGTSPISSIPYTLSFAFSPTLGLFTLYLSIALIAAQILILRKNFKKQALMQIPVSFLLSWFIDLTMNWLSFQETGSYEMKWILLIGGCLVLGIGVYLEILGDVVMLPGESFVNAIAVTYQKDFGKTKVAVDLSMTLIAAALGFLLFGKLAGVREGTAVAALLVGLIARFLKRKLSFLEKLIAGKEPVICRM
ncbi:YitT family protein [Anoxybacterium hadale]|uniref:YitT family protein n=1 Tax=Anoxybacterium hadale TaxID=3408580 RepID=A0ACD1AE05_9FIRM|nr:YitT family protein [Clostridiales bacterium]